MHDLFSKIYREETEAIPVNESLKTRVAKKIGFERAPRRFRALILFPSLAGAMVVLALAVLISKNPQNIFYSPPNHVVRGEKTDDWQYDPSASYEMGGSFQSLGALGLGASIGSPTSLGLNDGFGGGSDSLGFAVGGGKDVNTFRQNVANGYLPLPSTMNYEGLFYDYNFDTALTGTCTDLFCPSYAAAVSPDPLSGKEDTYLLVGLNSNLRQDAFARQPLDLVIVLDISGSMSSPFDSYYYDDPGAVQENPDRNKEKLEVAKEALTGLVDQLKPGDRLGVVLFDDAAYLAKPLRLISETDTDALKAHLKEIQTKGGTNQEAGIIEATKLYEGASEPGRERRMIMLTDAMPNQGETTAGGLLGMLKVNAARGIYTSIVGIGVDFQTDLVTQITDVRGANYSAVNDADAFRNAFIRDFDYLVTPLVFDLSLELVGSGYEIEKVYGSPSANGAGGIMHVNTLFPSKRTEGEVRGGIVLVKLHKTGDGQNMKLVVKYADRDGKNFTNEQTVTLPTAVGQGAMQNGMRKGIALARYADLMKHWSGDERAAFENKYYRPLEAATGLTPPPDWYDNASEWEQTSLPLRVNENYRNLFTEFKTWFAAEIQAIGDAHMEQETKLINTILASGS